MLRFISLLFAVITIAFAQNGPLTEDFQTWLSKNGYESEDFVRADLLQAGSYGGRTKANEKIKKEPVIFVHGNSDSALRSSFEMSGWTNSIAYFETKGYTSGELYATTWGDANPLNAQSRTHDCVTLQRIRKFFEAVIKYTNATKIDVISHSMGVTIARKVIKGGDLKGPTGSCSLGSSLHNKVDTFVGLSGANYGLCNCAGIETFMAPTCNKQNGFWPGDSCGLNYGDCGLHPLPFPCDGVTYSSFLTDLNNSTVKEGKYVYAAWSQMDDLIMYNDQVWGNPTSMIPTSTSHKIYPAYTHMQTKEQTAADQYDFVVNHV